MKARPGHLLTLLFLLLSPAVLLSAEPLADCGSCHEQSIARGKQSRYVHQPFLQGQCAECHVLGELAKPAVKRSAQALEAEQLEKVRWLRDISGVAEEHWRLIPGNQPGPLYYKAWDGQTRSPLVILELPDLQSLPELKSDLQPPRISNLRVADVRRGISTTASIRWQTDEFSLATVLYGRQSLNSSKTVDRLAQDHQLMLVGLDADTEYQVQVICRDLSGNSTQSQVLRFVTDRTYIEEEGRQESGIGLAGQEIRLHSELYRHQGQYLLIFKADRPVSLSFGVLREPESAGPVQVAPVLTSSAHPLLKSRLDTAITTCFSCHSRLKDSYSHPVNVFPRPGMTIPEEYPLLPDGRISCMSCHTSHGSNFEFRLIKSRKSELCRGCHRDY